MKKNFYKNWKQKLKLAKDKQKTQSKEGNIGAAINFLEVAGTTKKCADQVHE